MLKSSLLLVLVAFSMHVFAMDAPVKNEEGDIQKKIMAPQFSNSQSNGILLISLNILVIDDNKVNLAVMEKMLKELGCENITLVENAEAAVGLIKDKAEKNTYFNMIFTDINMPEMDGIDCAREIRKVPHMESVPIIAVTTEEKIEEKCLASGINALMSKPFTKLHLSEVLTKAFLNQ